MTRQPAEAPAGDEAQRAGEAGGSGDVQTHIEQAIAALQALEDGLNAS